MTALVRSLRPAPRKEPVVLFNGVPGEYAQFDFVEALLTVLAQRKPDSLLGGVAKSGVAVEWFG